MRLSLSQVVCSVNCVVKTVRVIEQSARKNMTLRHLLHVDSFGCLSKHGFDAFSANTVKRESTNHGFNACNSDAEERMDQPRFHWAQRQRKNHRRSSSVRDAQQETQKIHIQGTGQKSQSVNTLRRGCQPWRPQGCKIQSFGFSTETHRTPRMTRCFTNRLPFKMRG